MSDNSDLKLRLLTDRYRPFLLPFIFILFVIFSLSRVVMPRINVVTDGWQEVKEAKEEVESLETKLAFLRNLDEGKLKSDYDFLLQILPEAKEPFYSLTALEWLGTKSGVQVAQASFIPGEVGTESAQLKSKQDYETLSYTVSIRSNLEGLERFLNNLEKVAPLASTDTVSLDLSTGDVLATGLVIDTYSAYLPTKIGRPSDPIAGLDPEEEQFLKELREEVLIPTVDSNLLIGDPVGKNNPFN